MSHKCDPGVGKHLETKRESEIEGEGERERKRERERERRGRIDREGFLNVSFACDKSGTLAP